MLGCATAALSNEGMVIHSPSREALLAALNATLGGDGDGSPGDDRSWQLVTNRQPTYDALVEIGASHVAPAGMAIAGLDYLGYFATDLV
jgi:hypothetical protein